MRRYKPMSTCRLLARRIKYSTFRTPCYPPYASRPRISTITATSRQPQHFLIITVFIQLDKVYVDWVWDNLTRSTFESLAEHEKLSLVVNREHTSTSDTTENVGTCALEQRPNTFLCDNLATSIHGRLVLDSLGGQCGQRKK